MSITINDVARESGVSIATVSRVLSGKNSVSEKTFTLVMETSKKLGYKPKKTKETKNSKKKVMLIVGDIMNPFYLEIIQGITDVLNPIGIKIAIFYSYNDPKIEENYVSFAQEDNYNGIIMITATETVALIELLKKNVCPVVLVNRFIRSMDLDAVCIDNVRGGYMATEYMVKNGHKKIAHLAGPNNSTTSIDRLRGYMNALNDCGLEINKSAIYTGDLKRGSGEKFGEYYIEKLRDYSAVFCANNLMAAGFIDEISKYGLKVPDDVSVICFDDTPISTESPVKMTTVSKEPDVMGQVAAEIMTSVFKDPKRTLKRKIVFPPVLNERCSVKNLIKEPIK